PFKIRVYAFLLDFFVIAIYGIFVVGTISFVFRPYIESLFSSSPVTAELAGFVMITFPVSLYFILCDCYIWQGTLGKRKMVFSVVVVIQQHIGICCLVILIVIKFVPLEVVDFGILQLILPSTLSEMNVLIILNAVNIAILVYFIVPLTNKKRKNVYDWVAGTE